MTWLDIILFLYISILTEVQSLPRSFGRAYGTYLGRDLDVAHSILSPDVRYCTKDEWCDWTDVAMYISRNERESTLGANYFNC